MRQRADPAIDQHTDKLGGTHVSQHPNDPLHGVTLQMMLEQLVAHHGWVALGRMIEIRCFTHDPSIKSSLTFLRRTPWARTRVEALYKEMLLATRP